MFRKLFTLTLLAMALVATASAGITEIKQTFQGQTALLSGSSIMSAPGSNGSYLVCAYLDQPSGGTVAATLSWTDENGNAQTATAASGTASGGGCTPIRVEASTTPSVSTTGTIDSYYDLFITGFGFWPGQPQKQGGLTEAANYSGWPTSNTVLAGPTSETTYLAVAQVQLPGSGDGSVTLSWTDAIGGQSETLLNTNEEWVGLVRSQAETQVTALATSCSGCNVNIALVAFGTPATGSGPLTDYEYNLLDWTNATYPNEKTVFTQGSSGGFGVAAVNIAEQPNSGGIGEGLTGNWYPNGQIVASAGDSGQPANAVAPQIINADTSFVFWTTGTPSGASPTYSAEVDVIQF
jgi:hypothetical protein